MKQTMLERSPDYSTPLEMITIVSGLPRSGTSMMMQILEAGGMDILTDQIRAADDENPGGYYEFERVKQLKEGVVEWLPEAAGKVVKVIATLLPYLPKDYQYRVVFMERLMPEILASQRRMLKARGKDPDAVSDEEMARIYNLHLQQILSWMEKQANLRYLKVSFNDLIQNPSQNIIRLSNFLGGQLNLQAMQAVIDPSLYRQRASE